MNSNNDQINKKGSEELNVPLKNLVKNLETQKNLFRDKQIQVSNYLRKDTEKLLEKDKILKEATKKLIKAKADIKPVKENQESIDVGIKEAFFRFETKKILFEDAKSELESAENNVNEAQDEKTLIEQNIENIDHDIEAQNQLIAEKQIEINGANENYQQAQDHKNSINQDNYKWTEWWHSSQQSVFSNKVHRKMIAKFKGHHDKVPQGLDIDIKPNRIDLINYVIPVEIIFSIRTVIIPHIYKIEGFYHAKDVKTVHLEDSTRFNHDLNAANNRVDDARTRQDQLEAELQDLNNDLEIKQSLKATYENELKAVDSNLRANEMLKNKAETSVQDTKDALDTEQINVVRLQERLEEEKLVLEKAQEEFQRLDLLVRAIADEVEKLQAEVQQDEQQAQDIGDTLFKLEIDSDSTQLQNELAQQSMLQEDQKEKQETKEDELSLAVEVLKQAMKALEIDGATEDNVQNITESLSALESLDKDGRHDHLLKQAYLLENQYDTENYVSMDVQDASIESHDTDVMGYAQSG